MKSHLKTAHSIGVFMCKFCGKALENAKNIKRHELREHGNIEYGKIECQVCGSAFLEKGQLKIHMNDKHWNTRNFICDVCPKAFSQNAKLEDQLSESTRGRRTTCASMKTVERLSQREPLLCSMKEYTQAGSHMDVMLVTFLSHRKIL